MNRRSKIWLAVASIVNVINAAGGGYAIALEEGPHAGIHIVLLLVGSVWAWRLATRRDQADVAALPAGARLEQLQESVDAIAVEVERIGEAQRFSAKLKQEQARE